MKSVDLSQYHVAIFFMKNGRVGRQMRLSEFESILDGYVGLSDFADTDQKAVLVVMDQSLVIQSLVFFRVYFDENGRIDASWNVPIENLSAEGARGPNLGEGHIRLVCRSQTPRSSLRSALWDPSMAPGKNDFVAIRKAAQDNALRFRRRKAVEKEPEKAPEKPTEQGVGEEEHRSKLASLIKDQRLRIRTLESQHHEALQKLEREHRLALQALEQRHEEQKRQNERMQIMVERLKKKVAERNEDYLELQKQINAQADESAEQPSLSAENLLLREELEHRSRELEHMREALGAAEQDLEAVRNEAPQESDVLNRIRDGDAFLVVYNPGAGHMTLPFNDIGRYFANPLGYVAEYCGLSEPAYRRWLAHYEVPQCQHESGGRLCAEPLQRVNDPCDFQPGRDDRCGSHQE